MIEKSIIGAFEFFMLLLACMFLFYFILHVLFTPDENKIRKIIREELSEFKEKDE